VAFDAYLEIRRQVDQQINTALKCDTHISYLRRSCPCCFYKLEGEPELEFSSFVSIDGNNSLKRLGTTIRNTNDRLDSRTIVSDRWLTPAEVNRFKNEVTSQVKIYAVCCFATDIHHPLVNAGGRKHQCCRRLGRHCGRRYRPWVYPAMEKCRSRRA
jgi:hypothetical protein